MHSNNLDIRWVSKHNTIKKAAKKPHKPKLCLVITNHPVSIPYPPTPPLSPNLVFTPSSPSNSCQTSIRLGHHRLPTASTATSNPTTKISTSTNTAHHVGFLPNCSVNAW